MKKGFIVFFCISFIVASAFKVQSMTSHRSPLPPAPVVSQQPQQKLVDVPFETSFRGQYVCLPHKVSEGPQTLECALGLKVDDGSYIAMSVGDLSSSKQNTQFSTGARLEVKGLFVPIEQISTDRWQKYAIKGILQVKEVKQN